MGRWTTFIALGLLTASGCGRVATVERRPVQPLAPSASPVAQPSDARMPACPCSVGPVGETPRWVRGEAPPGGDGPVCFVGSAEVEPAPACDRAPAEERARLHAEARLARFVGERASVQAEEVDVVGSPVPSRCDREGTSGDERCVSSSARRREVERLTATRTRAVVSGTYVAGTWESERCRLFVNVCISRADLARAMALP